MTAVSLQTLHALGWTLLHFVWQGAALAALLAAALMVSRNANVRYAFGVGTLVLMMAAPVVTFGWLSRAPTSVAAAELNHSATSAAATEARLDHVSASLAAAEAGLNHASNADVVGSGLPTAMTIASSDATFASETTPASVGASEGALTPAAAAASALDRLVRALAASTNRADLMLWLVQAWFVGVMLLSVRTAGGLLWLARTQHGEIEPLSAEMHRQCLILQRRMGLQRHIRYGQSRSLDSPVVMGWFRPIVVVTTQAMLGLSPQQLQAIIAHELAHIRRYDAFVNLFQVGAEMFLFYHPAVWWVSRRIRIEREVCCDHEALAACGEPVSYARALTMMEEWRAAPGMLMAANRSPLAERVLRLLGMQGSSARSRAAGLGACVLGVLAALFSGSVFVAAAQATTDDLSPTVTAKPEPHVSETRIAASPAPAATPAPAPEPPPPVDPKPAVAPKPSLDPMSALDPRPAPVAKPALAPKPAFNPQPALDSKPAPDAKPALAPKPAPRPQAAKPAMPAQPAEEARGPIASAVANKSSYIQSIVATGLQNVDIDQLIAMKVQGITPEYIQGMMATNLHPEPEQLIAMKVHGVTPEYIEEMRRLVADIDIDRIIAMKVHGITPQYIHDMQASGLDIRVADEYIGAKVQGITPEFVKRAIEHGFQDLTVEKLMMLRNIDVI